VIPIVINNFNRLTTTKKLVEDLQRLGYDNIHILDNASTYPPLLEWYATEPCTLKLLDQNLQGLSIYNSEYINTFKDEWIVYTDSDIELSPDTYPGFIEYIVTLAEKYDYKKAGLSLRIDDLPATSFAMEYQNWERKYWESPLEEDVYDAQLDTTFCIIKPTLPFDYRAIRVGGKLTARHIPWYVNFNELDPEEQYFLDKSLDWSTYKRYYLSHVSK
jgi:hypothetical protein